MSVQDTAASPVQGLSHLIIETPGIEAAEEFYTKLFGFVPAGRDMWAGCERSSTLRTPSGQFLVLADAKPLKEDLAVSAIHQGYAVTAQAREQILAAVRAKGGEVFNYREDRPSEVADNVYITDPSGNRVQLLARANGNGAGIDHVAIEVNDILWSEQAFGEWLSMPIEHRIGWAAMDYVEAKAAGEASAIPGSRYWNERYSVFETERKALRPTPQIYFTLSSGSSVAVYLANRNYQSTPDTQRLGTPRLGLRLQKGGIDAVARTLESKRIKFEGPVQHGANMPIAKSLYMRDLGGNFIEFTEAA
ncbi:MAG TPA: VOC family protein [Alphaproteobacteria bacterium]|jgi:catechol-2,3-dioxygenase